MSPARADVAVPLRPACVRPGRRSRVRRTLVRVTLLVVALVPLALAPGRPASGASRWGWPLPPPHPVTRTFAPGPHPWSPGHRGVDLGADPGTPVLAAGSGRVAFAAALAGRGVVVVDHGALRTTYEPLTPEVPVGATVRTGDVLGTLDPGHEGCPAAACLHWGLLRGDTYLDPLRLVAPGPVRLLPRADLPGSVPDPAPRADRPRGAALGLPPAALRPAGRAADVPAGSRTPGGPTPRGATPEGATARGPSTAIPDAGGPTVLVPAGSAVVALALAAGARRRRRPAPGCPRGP